MNVGIRIYSYHNFRPKITPKGIQNRRKKKKLNKSNNYIPPFFCIPQISKSSDNEKKNSFKKFSLGKSKRQKTIQ